MGCARVHFLLHFALFLARGNGSRKELGFKGAHVDVEHTQPTRGAPSSVESQDVQAGNVSERHITTKQHIRPVAKGAAEVAQLSRWAAAADFAAPEAHSKVASSNLTGIWQALVAQAILSRRVIFSDEALCTTNKSLDCMTGQCVCSWHQSCYKTNSAGHCSLSLPSLVFVSLGIIACTGVLLIVVRACFIMADEEYMKAMFPNSS